MHLSPLLKNLFRILRTVAIVYLAVAALAYIFQRRLQYMPDASPVPLPRDAGHEAMEEFTATAKDGVKVLGWYWPGLRPVDLLILHGNAGNRAHRLEWLEDLRELGLGLCIVDYRGYGGSGGSPTEEGLYLDAEAAEEWLRSRSRSAIVYYGESVGTAVAVELARRRPPAALVLQSAFSSAADVGQRAYPFLPVRLLMKDRYDALSRIREVRCPILFIHGDRDSIVPLRFGRALHDAAPEPKEWLEVAGADHNDLPWVGGAGYRKAVGDFLGRRVAAGTSR